MKKIIFWIKDFGEEVGWLIDSAQNTPMRLHDQIGYIERGAFKRPEDLEKFLMSNVETFYGDQIDKISIKIVRK